MRTSFEARGLVATKIQGLPTWGGLAAYRKIVSDLPTVQASWRSLKQPTPEGFDEAKRTLLLEHRPVECLWTVDQALVPDCPPGIDQRQGTGEMRYWLFQLDTRDLLQEDPRIWQTALELTRHPLHPTADLPWYTVGWIRTCSAGDIITVEEVQTDISFGRYPGHEPTLMRAIAAVMRGGHTYEAATSLTDILIPYTDRFFEDAWEFATNLTNGPVELLSYEAKVRIQPKTPRWVYDELPRHLGLVKRTSRNPGLPGVVVWVQPRHY